MTRTEQRRRVRTPGYAIGTRNQPTNEILPIRNPATARQAEEAWHSTAGICGGEQWGALRRIAADENTGNPETPAINTPAGQDEIQQEPMEPDPIAEEQPQYQGNEDALWAQRGNSVNREDSTRARRNE